MAGLLEMAGRGPASDHARFREPAEAFPFYKRVKCTGRPPVPERDRFVCFLVRQLFDITFRQLEGLMTFLTEFFQIEKVPDHTVFSRYNRSRRWSHIWQRFHDFVMYRCRDDT